MIIYPEVQELNKQLDDAVDRFEIMRNEISSTFGNVKNEQTELRKQRIRVDEALEQLNKSEGNLVFGKEMLQLNIKLNSLENALKLATVRLSEKSGTSENTNTNTNTEDAIIRDLFPK